MTSENPRVSCVAPLAGVLTTSEHGGFSMPFVFHSNRDCLVGLAVLQAWLRLPPIDGAPYGPGWFYGRNCAPLTTLTNANRKVTLRLARLVTCFACSADLPAGSTGDHVIPTARGGSDGAENYVPICKRCNSSKGVKDLLAWWNLQGFPLSAMPFDVLVVYLRVQWRHLDTRGELDQPAPTHYHDAITDWRALLPSPGHDHAFLNATARGAAWRLLP